MDKQTTLLIILDGFGHSPKNKYNAIAQAHTPFLDTLWAKQYALIQTSGTAVGLPDGQMGNSEVGHMTLGAGRIILQDLTHINNSVTDGSFFKNPLLNKALATCEQKNKNLHIMGLLSNGGVHSHIDHIKALLTLSQQFDIQHIYLHAFLDGRDCPPQSAQPFIEAIEKQAQAFQPFHFASISGRYYAMDRDQKWDRTQKMVELLMNQKTPHVLKSPMDALNAAYKRGETDEFVYPSITCPHFAPISHNDIVVMTNFRSDRVRQITQSLTDPHFSGFKTNQKTLDKNSFICLTEYDSTFNLPIIFKNTPLKNTLPQVLAQHNKTQLRLSETEKYAHITFFFNGGVEIPLKGESRHLIPSPNVANYKNTPKMSAEAITNYCIEALERKKYDFILINFANADMVGHTGDLAAAKQAIECLDNCLQKIAQHMGSSTQLLITADHGNAEKMFDEKTNAPHTAHTNFDVPLFYVGQKKFSFKNGQLQDIAPTLLEMMGLEKPKEMTGKSLIKK